MFVDASALTAILLIEDDAASLLRKIGVAQIRVTSPMAVWETTVALGRALNLPTTKAAGEVTAFLEEFRITSIAIAPEAAAIALDAFDRFGKGRHPAGLNFGDCFAYACAKHLRVPLLFKGNDFALTDIEAG